MRISWDSYVFPVISLRGDFTHPEEPIASNATAITTKKAKEPAKAGLQLVCSDMRY